jgi:hypothetical protein
VALIGSIRPGIIKSLKRDNHGLEKLSKILMEKYNNRKLDDSSGFTPHQMYQIIHSPFHPGCPIKMFMDIEIDHLKSSPVFDISYSLLDKINAGGKMKLTAMENLPGRLIKSIYDEGFFPDRMIERGIYTLRMEKDWLILHPFNALSLRFFYRLAYWFGFVEYQSIPDLISLHENVKIKKN